MTDSLVRTAFHKSILRSSHEDPNTYVLDELGLKHGENRADIAVLNGKIIGYEIKTERDSLSRLAAQIVAYNEVFDSVYIISGKKHLKKVSLIVPDWWGIYVIQEQEQSSPSFICIREASINPNKNSYGIAQLLWKDEAIELLNTRFSCNVREKSTRDQLYNILISKCNCEELSNIVVKCLKQRSGWRTSPKSLL
jgi:hypothetical protein